MDFFSKIFDARLIFDAISRWEDEIRIFCKYFDCAISFASPTRADSVVKTAFKSCEIF